MPNTPTWPSPLRASAACQRCCSEVLRVSTAAEMQCGRSLWHRECKVRAPTRVRARVQVRVAHARACTRVRAAVAMESTWWLGLLMWQVFTTTGSCAGVAHPRPPCRNTLVPTRWQPAAGAREHSNGVGAPGRCQSHAPRVCRSPLFALPARFLFAPTSLRTLPARQWHHRWASALPTPPPARPSPLAPA